MKQDSVPTLLKKFLSGISQAEAAAGMLVHEHIDPRFIDLRFKLGAIKGATIQIAKKATGVQVRNVKPN